MPWPGPTRRCIWPLACERDWRNGNGGANPPQPGGARPPASRTRAKPPSVNGGPASARTRLDGLVDDPRPGRPRTVTGARAETVLRTTVDADPATPIRWSSQAAARAVLSGATVTRIGASPPVGTVRALHRSRAHRQGARRGLPSPDQPERGPVPRVDGNRGPRKRDRSAPVPPRGPACPGAPPTTTRGWGAPPVRRAGALPVAWWTAHRAGATGPRSAKHPSRSDRGALAELDAH